jgi:hypothetical protein
VKVGGGQIASEPHSKLIEQVEKLLRRPEWYIGDVVDLVREWKTGMRMSAIDHSRGCECEL